MSCVFPLTLRVECTAATDYQGTMKLAFPLVFPITILLYSLVLYEKKDVNVNVQHFYKLNVHSKS